MTSRAEELNRSDATVSTLISQSDVQNLPLPNPTTVVDVRYGGNRWVEERTSASYGTDPAQTVGIQRNPYKEAPNIGISGLSGFGAANGSTGLTYSNTYTPYGVRVWLARGRLQRAESQQSQQPRNFAGPDHGCDARPTSTRRRSAWLPGSTSNRFLQIVARLNF